jgi:hypothetical protein
LNAMSRERRTVLRRLLAWVWIVGYMATFAGLSVALAAMSAGATPQQVWPYMLALCAFSFPAEIAIHALWIWRRCDRCRKRLFPLVAGGISPIGDIPEHPDIRAATFLGSHHLGAIVGMATRGTVVCVHCGHKDGAPPDYVVVAPR